MLPDYICTLLIYNYTSVIGCSTIKTNSKGTHLDLFCVPVLAIASLDEIIQVLVLIWTWIFALQYFQYMNDHIPEEQYFHKVNCMFRRFAELWTL